MITQASTIEPTNAAPPASSMSPKSQAIRNPNLAFSFAGSLRRENQNGRQSLESLTHF